MEQYKRAKVIMLPTEDNHSKFAKYILDSSFGGCIKENELCTTTSTIGWSNIFKPQHLYIISDDEIKEGDLYIESDHSGFGFRKYKIIATTDTSLNYETPFYGMDADNNFPQPSQQFIEKYIESYNKGNIITDVLVEYEYYFKGEDISRETSLGKLLELKINTKDNTITIKKLKDSWNREELINIIKKVYYDAEVSNCGDTVDKWIKENL